MYVKRYIKDSVLEKIKAKVDGYDEAYKHLLNLIKKNGDSCIDNERIAEVDNLEEVENYNNQIQIGCCGFEDSEYYSEQFYKRFKIGFNYGH